MASSLFTAAKAVSDQIDRTYSQMEALEKSDAFEDMNNVKVVTPGRIVSSMQVESAVFLAFKSAALTELRNTYAGDIADYNTDYPDVAYTQLATPSALSLMPSSNSMDIEWPEVANAESYKVYYAKVNDFSKALMVVEVPDDGVSVEFAYTLNGLTPSTVYYFWVVAKASGYQDSATVTDTETTSA